jgi:hypothetical protein
MSAINHELKNTAEDTPGYLIDKFASSGKIIITVYTDVFTHKIAFKLAMNTKDLFEHLLKPTSPFPFVSINSKLETNTPVSFVPVIFPSGIVESVTMLTDNYSNIESFEIACFGNDKNVITGAKRWFYVSSNSMTFDGKASYRFKDGQFPSIVPYSYNFMAYKLNFKEGGYLLANSAYDTAKSRLNELDYQWCTSDIQLSTTTTIPEGLNKSVVDVVPFIQFNLLKAT